GQPWAGPVAGRVRSRAAGCGHGARAQRRAVRRLPDGRRARARGGAPGRGAAPRLEVVGTTEAFRDPDLGRAVSAQSGTTEAQLARGDLPSPFELTARRRDYLATLVPI